MNASNDDAESVDAFLERIASLKDKRDREDEQRTRKLEEEIMQGRRERQARRAERARPLSPSKNSQPATSPAVLDPLYYASSPEHATRPPINLSPSPQSYTEENSALSQIMKTSALDDTPTPLPPSPTKSSTPSRTNATAVSRSGTLSWQQRPSSRDSNTPRSRPLSRHKNDTASEATAVDDGRTRDEIAQSLSSKDPSWFRQTADRGASSYAYRKSREEGQSDVGHSSHQLPGLSQGPSVEPKKAPFPSSSMDRSRSPSQASTAPDTGSWGNRFSSMSSQSTLGGPKSPLPTKSSQRLGLPAEGLDTDQPSAQPTGLTSLQGQLSRDRPPSPTKGLGGFVQSAMMKRSDSVNKRWSAQAAPGLSRGNSIASYRGGMGHSGSMIGGQGSPPREANFLSRGPTTSPSAKSRPTSSHSTSTVLHHAESTTRASYASTLPNDVASTTSHRTSVEDTPVPESSPQEQAIKPRSPVLKSPETLPVSPTKTMDSKRWSPTKASWLESALARPDSPKLTSPNPQTPSWMANLQKSRLSKEDAKLVENPTSSLTLVSPAALMRSPPPGGHAQPLSIGGLPNGFNSGLTKRTSPENPRDTITAGSQPAQSTSTIEPESPSTTPANHPSRRPESPATTPVSKTAERKKMPSPAPTHDGKSPPPLRAKPRTSPQTDFRSNLRSRQKTSGDSAPTEPEFKNVFGKLKRTATQNYVAPDELKDNILRGKAALNLTSGPQKTETVDEFKESILKKKESMKVEAKLPRKNVAELGRIDTAHQKSANLPEALAKRCTLGKRIDSSKTLNADTVPELPASDARPMSVKAAERSAPSLEDQSHSSTEAAPPAKVTTHNIDDFNEAKPQEHERANTEQAVPTGIRQNRATTKQVSGNNSVYLRNSPSTAAQTAETSKDNKPVSKLATRINPSLANILSRGRTSATSSRNASSEDVFSTRNTEARSTITEPDSSASSLTHMTKARAKGPRRRLPKPLTPVGNLADSPSKANQTDVFVETLYEARPEELHQDAISQEAPHSGKNQSATVAPRTLANLINNNDKVARPSAARSKPVSPGSADHHVKEKEEEPIYEVEMKGKTKPAVAAKSPNPKKVSSPPLSTSITVAAESDKKSITLREEISEKAKADSQSEQEKLGKTIKCDSQLPGIRPPKSSASMNSALPPKSHASKRRELLNNPSGVKTNGTPAPVRKPNLSGLGLKLDSGRVHPPTSQLTPPPEELSTMAVAPCESLRASQGGDALKKHDPPTLRQRHPDVADLLTEFFDERPKLTDKAEVDAQAVILNRPNADSKSKVIKTQVWQINSDGKKESLPPQQEHILFEDCMYLCVHSFETPSGSAATEVYLWSGDGVGEAALEDAQLFCRKEARENNAKLELLRQGKEPAKFFQALGGIVITRRSRNSSLYMLCGRRHLGHVAFDEVDVRAASLCSAFPYLISAKFGKLYLWKGKGSGADEIGCARLIGMDLDLTGEIEEVEEGEETPGFLESFGGTMRSQASSHQWSLRSRSNDYGCRIFRVELEQSKGMSGFWTRRGSSPAKASKADVQEIYPFCQRDLNSPSIFVLDAYFNIFVHVIAEANSKSAEFVTALMFAQDYAILTASLEDRPSIPTCKITFYGAPPDFTAAFRKWESPSSHKGRHQKQCQVIALNDALEVLSDGKMLL